MNEKTAIVFGGSRGIGAASVAALARDGWDVALTYISNPPDPMPTVEGARIAAYQVDINEPEQIADTFAATERDFGSLPHCIVVSAGINVPGGPLAQFDRDNFRRLVEVNIVGAFNLLREAAAQVPDGGSIIAITTALVRHPLPGGGPYIASKSAVECLIRSLAKELAGRNVRVNAVAPGPVDTDLFRSGKDEAAVKRFEALSPFNRVGHPSEVAEVVSFLASDKASWVHGQIVQPNGGLV